MGLEKRTRIVAALLLCTGLLLSAPWTMASETRTNEDEEMAIATFAGGCFWCMEPPFEQLDGVEAVIAGYTGGHVENPTYEQVTRGRTGHYEAAKVLYDPQQVSYETLLETFWRNIDPTDKGGQFADRGPQYRTAVFYHDEEQKRLAEKSKAELDASDTFDEPVRTEILPASEFYEAEEYHQDYYQKNPLHYNRYKVGSGRAGFIEKFREAHDKLENGGE